jgi:hypothetical protein
MCYLASARELCRLPRVRNSIVDLQPLERRRLRRIEPKFLALFDKELVLFQIVVETAGLHFFAPAFDLRRCFLLAASVEPFNHLLVARALLDLRFEISAFYAFEAEERAIQRTIEMIFPDVPRYERPAFIDCAAKNGVTAHANARTTRRFPC